MKIDIDIDGWERIKYKNNEISWVMVPSTKVIICLRMLYHPVKKIKTDSGVVYESRAFPDYPVFRLIERADSVFTTLYDIYRDDELIRTFFSREESENYLTEKFRADSTFRVFPVFGRFTPEKQKFTKKIYPLHKIYNETHSYKWLKHFKTFEEAIEYVKELAKEMEQIKWKERRKSST